MALLSVSLLLPTKTPSVIIKRPSNLSLLNPLPLRSFYGRRCASRTFAKKSPRFPGLPSFPDGLGKVGEELGRVGEIANDVVSGDPGKAIGDVKDGVKDDVEQVGEIVSGIFGRRPGKDAAGDVEITEVGPVSDVVSGDIQVAGVVSDVVSGDIQVAGDDGSSDEKIESGGIISGVVAGAGGIVSGIVAGAPAKVIGEIKNETTQVTQIASDAVAGAPGKVISEIKKDTTQVTQIASDVTSGTLGPVSDVTSGTIETVSDVTSSKIGTVSDVISAAPGKVITEIKNETTQVTQIASDISGAPGKVADLAGAVVANAPDMVAGEIKHDVGKATQLATDVVTGRPDKLVGDIAGEVGRVGGVVSGVLSGDGVLKKKLDSMELKKALVDTVVGTELGFRASSNVRAEVAELVTKLEMVNPNPDPIENTGLLDGDWVLVYTAYSELLPLLAIGSTPLLKVEKITQDIDTRNQTVANSVTLSSGILSFTFSASASFQVETSSRIQVQFKEAIFKPPEIKPRLDLPDNVEVLGQKIPLNPVQQVLNPVQQVLSPVQDAASSISQSLLGLPSLKLPIPGERTKSWLLVSYLDENLRISRGDGGLFVLVKQGTSLLL